MSIPTIRNLNIKQTRLPFDSETTKSTLKEPQCLVTGNKQNGFQPGGLTYHETNMSLVCGNGCTRKLQSGAVNDLNHMTD